MKVVIINRSDDTGGAAVVSRRLMDALRDRGVDAKMLVCEKRTFSPFIHLTASPRRIRQAFLAERLKIFMANGFDRSTLFRIDTASDGLPLHRHPLVREADVICLGWVNQGMLSIKGIRKIVELGKPVVWTMHDMWCMTGICHYSLACNRYARLCGDCPLMGVKAAPDDLSYKIHTSKSNLYALRGIHFIAVSNWLASCGRRSSLLRNQPLSVIHNPFPLPETPVRHGKAPSTDTGISLLFGAARLDDPIKGLDILHRSLGILTQSRPELKDRLSLTLFGTVKNPSALVGFPVRIQNLGRLAGADELAEAYSRSDILLAPSRFENLPGTLVEAQAYGAVPVAFLRGGQADIITDGETGVLAEFVENDMEATAGNFADAISRAIALLSDAGIKNRMRKSVEQKFAASVIAGKYIDLFNSLLRI